MHAGIRRGFVDCLEKFVHVEGRFCFPGKLHFPFLVSSYGLNKISFVLAIENCADDGTPAEQVFLLRDF
jgi:hypothetical protein